MSKRTRKRKPCAREGRVPRNALHGAIAPYPRVFTMQELLQGSSCLLISEVVEAIPESIREAVLDWLDGGWVGEPPIPLAELVRIIHENLARAHAPHAECVHSVQF